MHALRECKQARCSGAQACRVDAARTATQASRRPFLSPRGQRCKDRLLRVAHYACTHMHARAHTARMFGSQLGWACPCTVCVHTTTGMHDTCMNSNGLKPTGTPQTLHVTVTHHWRNIMQPLQRATCVTVRGTACTKSQLLPNASRPPQPPVPYTQTSAAHAHKHGSLFRAHLLHARARYPLPPVTGRPS